MLLVYACDGHVFVCSIYVPVCMHVCVSACGDHKFRLDVFTDPSPLDYFFFLGWGYDMGGGTQVPKHVCGCLRTTSQSRSSRTEHGPSWAILLAPSALYLETGLSLNLELASSTRLVSSRGLPVSVSPALRLLACTPIVIFLFGVWDLNSVPHS